MSGHESLTQLVDETTRAHEWWAVGNLGVPGMPDWISYKCRCGWRGDEPRAHQAAAVVAALAEKYAIVELPEPPIRKYDEWYDDPSAATWNVWIDRKQQIQVRHKGFGTSTEVGAFAAALLAAAARAGEAEQ